MQKCQSRENERPTSVQSVLSSPIHSLLHWPAAAVCSVTLSSAPFLVLVVDCCQRQCTGHSLPLSLCVYCQPSTAGLISDQANQIWSRNVHVCPLCPAFCVCVWHRLWCRKWQRREMMMALWAACTARISRRQFTLKGKERLTLTARKEEGGEGQLCAGHLPPCTHRGLATPPRALLEVSILQSLPLSERSI